MPQSKKDASLTQQERDDAAKKPAPEEMAARALSIRAEADIEDFCERLSNRFKEIAISELKLLFPHTKPNIKNCLGTDGFYDATLFDVMQLGVSEAEAGRKNYWQAAREVTLSCGDLSAWMLRTRLRALALDVLKEETAKEVHKGYKPEEDEVPF